VELEDASSRTTRSAASATASTWSTCSGATIRGNTSEDNLRYGLHFMFSSENRYIGNTFRRNGAGVAVMYSKNVVIDRDNTFEDNWGPTSYGLLVKEISDSRIEGNRFVGNTVALSSEGSQRVHVANNRFVRNGWAARVMANSQENRFTDNDFIENSFDVTTNSRRNFNTFEGNYWSRYAGYDLDGDGVGDVPFRPVRLFSLLVERTPVALVLLRSVFVDLLDIAERVAPVLTPETLVDERPRMQEVQP
jgi:nitrous oxidase accessory protein